MPSFADLLPLEALKAPRGPAAAPAQACPPAPGLPETWASEEEAIRAAFQRMDQRREGAISKLQLVWALRREPHLAARVLPGVDRGPLADVWAVLDAADAVFAAVGRDPRRMTLQDFLAHCRRTAESRAPPHLRGSALRQLFDAIDANGDLAISKLELLSAVQRGGHVAELVLPGLDFGGLAEGRRLDAVLAAFRAISGGKPRITYAAFEEHFGRAAAAAGGPRQGCCQADRRGIRVFAIGAGFQSDNQALGACISKAGFTVRWMANLALPDHPGFQVAPHLAQLSAAIEEFRPHVVLSASRGGAYVAGLWKAGLWRGPTVMINAHPDARQLPPEAPVVVAHGSNDEVFCPSRAELEKLVGGGTASKRHFLYYAASSGRLAAGGLARAGDRHSMESLLAYDCLPRLIEGVACAAGPELHMVRTWRQRLPRGRLEAEAWLGHRPDALRRHWAPEVHRGQTLVEVPPGFEEFARVSAVFKAAPPERPAHRLSPQAQWECAQVVRVERVQNWGQSLGSSQPYCESLERSLADQGVGFEPGVHTCWAFHGTDAVESIVRDPVAGFQPLAAGKRGAPVWGLGTYFSRDARYVADSPFCGRTRDGSRQMLMCLLMTGMPCLGDPQHRGVLPFRSRQQQQRYNSSVDSLSSPEVYIIQHPGAAHPGYVITFQ